MIARSGRFCRWRPDAAIPRPLHRCLGEPLHPVLSCASASSLRGAHVTVSSLRLRGYGKPCYNVLDFDGDEVSIHRVFPFEGERHLMAKFVLFETRHHREAPVQQIAGAPES